MPTEDDIHYLNYLFSWGRQVIDLSLATQSSTKLIRKKSAVMIVNEKNFLRKDTST